MSQIHIRIETSCVYYIGKYERWRSLGGDHFVDTGTAGRKIIRFFKMWLALTEMHMHGTRERLMQQENFG